MSSYPSLSTELTKDAALDISAAGATEIIGSKPIDARRLNTLSAQVRVSGLAGAGDGTIKLQVSDVLDYINPAYPFPASDTDADWVDVSGASCTLTADGTFTFSVNTLPQGFARLLFTKNGATAGSVEVFVTCKNG